MKELHNAILLYTQYNRMKFWDVVKEFEEYTDQKVPKEVVEDFSFCGLSNIHFLTSDFINRWGLKNLLQFENEKTPSHE